MNRYEDRLLELDLREVLNLESPPDVWPVLAQRLAPAQPRLRHLRGRTRKPSVARYVPWAAAALVLLSLGVLWWAQQPSEDSDVTIVDQPPTPVPVPVPPIEPAGPLGEAEGDVMIAALDGTVREGTKIEIGERVVVPSQGGVIRLQGGAYLRFADAAWLAFTEDDAGVQVTLARGSCTGGTGARELILRTGPGEVGIGPESEFGCERREVPSEEHESAWLGGFVEPRPADLLVSVSTGSVRAEGKQAGEGELLVWLEGLPPRATPLPSADTRTVLDQHLQALEVLAATDVKGPGGMDAHKTALQGSREIERRLVEDPVGWGYAVPWLERRTRDLEEEEAGRMALRVLVLDPDLRALDAIHLRLRELDTEARLPEFLPLAERTEDPVAMDIARRQVRGSTDPFDVYAATFLALRGDDVGRAVLETVLAQPDAWPRNPAAHFAAAAGLHQLGETQHWVALRTRLQAAVEKAIDLDLLRSVQWPVTVASYFAPVVREGRPVLVSNASRRIQEHGRGLTLDTAEDIRRVVSGLP